MEGGFMPIQYGDIILVQGDDPLSKMIKSLTRSNWSHTLLAVGGGQFAQMGSLGFTIGPQSMNRPFAILRHKELMNPYSTKTRGYMNNMNQVIEQLRVRPPRFDFIKLIILGVKLLGQNMQASVSSVHPEAFVCSGLVDYVYERAGLDLLPNKDPKNTTPANLAALAFGQDPVFTLVYSSIGKL